MYYFSSVISILVALLLLPRCLLFGASPEISFFSGDLEYLRQEAANQQLPYLIYFGLPGQPACQQLESQTFSYAPLASFVSSNMLAYHVDATDGPYSEALIRHYHVKGFPTILLFDHRGQQREQFFGYVSGQDLHRDLFTLLNVANRPFPTMEEQISLYDDSEVEKEVVPNYVPERESSSHTSLFLNQYDLANRIESAKFGIKVGKFSNPDRLEGEVMKYERLWHGSIYAYKEQIRGRDYYILILGSYDSLEEADAYAAPMQQIAAISTEVVDLSSL